ncbi:MAG: MnhB domain-containing protein, partial [Terracidiphilus sp.]
MKRPWRKVLFFAGAVGIACLFAVALQPIAHPRDIRNRDAAAVNSRTFAQRNVTDAVSAVNFDFRGFDTLGEEFILLVSVLGSLVLLRMVEDRKERVLRDAAEPSRDVGPSDAIRLWILAMIAPKVAFAIYIVTHGQLTPGGGFQGGVLMATAALILYLGEGFTVLRNVISHPLTHMLEGAGAAGFLLIGMLALFWGEPFLTNVL